jgi:hypothetical protein
MACIFIDVMISVEAIARDANLFRRFHLLEIIQKNVRLRVNTGSGKCTWDNMECMVVTSKYQLLGKFIKCLPVFILYLKAKITEPSVSIVGEAVTQRSVSLLWLN